MGAEVRSSNEGSTKATLSRDEVRHLISLGHVLVLHRRSVYRLNNWLSRHPGGHLAILHFVGRDASNEIEAYHCKDTIERVMRHYIIAQVKSEDFSDEVGWKPLTPLVQLSKEGAFGRVEDYAGEKGTSRNWKQDLEQWRAGKTQIIAGLVHSEELEPPQPPASIDPAQQYKISRAWETLHEKLEDEGLYDSRAFWRYRVELVRYFGLFAAFLYVFVNASRTCK
jgi:delta8-fatty-acid desaturase